jgi:8-oxo-dGTP pyrophosphatase MutT (NUDIX family)
LERDPNLFATRLHLGKILLGLGQRDPGIAELERAYQLNRERARPALTEALVAQARAANQAGDWSAVQDLAFRIAQVDPANPEPQRMLAEAEGALEREGARKSGAFGFTRQQLGEILSSAQKRVRILGVVALDPSWEDLAGYWASKLQNGSGFEITVLCESDNLLFSKSLTYDTDSATDRKSFHQLKFIRDRAITDLPDYLAEAGVPSKVIRDSVSIEIMHLPVPLSIVQIDDRIFANLWLHRIDDYFEQITVKHSWYTLLSQYISTYFDPEQGRKYACELGDEVLELYDHDRIPRGMYPRSSFYDTDYSQLVVWAFVFDRQGRLLIHRRADNAKDNQGMWDKSVGGHIEFEDVDTAHAVCREVVEELFVDEAEQGYSSLTRWAVADEDMIYLGEWRPRQRRRHPFYEIGGFNREWTFFRLVESQQLYSPRIMPDGTQRRIRVISDAFLFVAGPALSDESLGELKNSRFKLIELAELKSVMDQALRGSQVPGFDASQSVPKFTPDLVNIMTGRLRDILEEFSQYVKRYVRREESRPPIPAGIGAGGGLPIRNNDASSSGK